MSDLFIYIFSSACFIVFLFASYFSNAWAKVKKNNNKQSEKLEKMSELKLIINYAKTSFKSVKTIEWFCILLSAIVATIAIVAVQLLNMHIVFVVKILISLIVLIVAAFVDFRTHTIPNILSVVLVVLRVLFVPIELVYQRDVFKTLVISSVIGILAIFIILFVVHKATKSGFGMGDVKLLSSLGFMVGISSCLTTILFGMTVAAILGMILILLKQKTKKDTVPFGPFILLGFITSVVLGVF